MKTLLVMLLLTIVSIIPGLSQERTIDDDLRDIHHYFDQTEDRSVSIEVEGGEVTVERNDEGYLFLRVPVRIETPSGIVVCDGSLQFTGTIAPAVSCDEETTGAALRMLPDHEKAVSKAWSRAYQAGARLIAQWIKETESA